MRLRTEDVTWQEIDGELVLLDLARSTYLTTNATGAYLAKLLLDETSEEELAASLQQHYSIEADAARSDVRDFLAELGRLQLLA